MVCCKNVAGTAIVFGVARTIFVAGVAISIAAREFRFTAVLVRKIVVTCAAFNGAVAAVFKEIVAF